MKASLFCFLIAVFAGSLALPQSSTTTTKYTPAKKKKAVTPAKKTTTTAANSKTASSKNTSAKKKTAAKTTAKKKAPAGPPRQPTPTADRYKEIQQALVDKGYLKSEPTGVWDDQSSQALKQFQTDQHLSPTGKISSLSLINLGLGPKPSTTSAAIPGASALQGAHSPDPADLPPPPETLPAPEN